jgi:hypothetical protein
MLRSWARWQAILLTSLFVMTCFFAIMMMPEAHAWGFTITPTSQTADPGQTVYYTPEVFWEANEAHTSFTVSVLALQGIPFGGGSDCVDRTPPFTCQIFVDVPASASPGTYTLSFYAHPSYAGPPKQPIGSDDRTASVSLIVKGTPTLDIFVSPTTRTVSQGSSATFTVTVPYIPCIPPDCDDYTNLSAILLADTSDFLTKPVHIYSNALGLHINDVGQRWSIRPGGQLQHRSHSN